MVDIEEMDPLSAWDWHSDNVVAGAVEGGGLINETWGVAVDGEPVAVLQLLNRNIFDAVLHYDIEAITQRLVARGRLTPVLIPTRDGQLWHEDEDGNVWRCLTWVGTRTIDKLQDPADARSAGFLVGRWHSALFDLDHAFHFTRPGAHDTVAHIAAMQDVLFTHRNHRLRRHVLPLADEILELWALWDGPRDLPQRLLHGDLKISNVRFDGPDAVALIDLDTMQKGTLDVELGDALRSWCNPSREDDGNPRFDLALFEAAMSGYIDGTRGLPLERAEWRSIVPGVLRITVELASRFARDALEESYFAWDQGFGSAGEHNLARARAMTALAHSVHDNMDEAEAILVRLRNA